MCADAARAHKRVDTCGFPPLVYLPFPLEGLAQTRDRRPLRKRERQSGYRCVSFVKYSQFTDRLLLHRWFTLRRRNITVLRNSLVWCLRKAPANLGVWSIYLRRCCLLQRAHELRDTGMSRLLEVADLCSSTLSDPANRLRKTRKKKSSAVPLFEAVTYRQSAPD